MLAFVEKAKFLCLIRVKAVSAESILVAKQAHKAKSSAEKASGIVSGAAVIFPRFEASAVEFALHPGVPGLTDRHSIEEFDRKARETTPEELNNLLIASGIYTRTGKLAKRFS